MMRSFLYIPGNEMRFIEKAHLRGADAIVIDLEDAVPIKEKTRAREALLSAVPHVGQNGARVFVRVNHNHDRLLADVMAACRAGAFGLFLPKVSSTDVLNTLDSALHSLETELGREPLVFVPLIENARGILNAQAIADGPRVFGLCAGAEDLATSMGAQPVPEVLRVPKIIVHLAAKAADRLSIGLFRSVADYRDLETVRASVNEARLHGFDGATCIHPSVVPILNEGFSPSPDELERARRLMKAAEAAERDGIGAFTFEGTFVDVPVVSRARALLTRFG